MQIREKSGLKPHSAEYFGEYRDHWWNIDFLQLMVRRLSLEKTLFALDVGCGIGHWGQLLASVLPPSVRFEGIDREPKWIEKASLRARERGLSGRFRYQRADANQVPYSDQSFDLVTCQTVLIHMRDPKAVLAEMLRVLKPGGTLLVAEPNNFANAVIGHSLSELRSVDETLAMFRFWFTCERGKKALGLGCDSVGDLLPGYLAELGACDIQVKLCDKAAPLIAPYESPDQAANAKQAIEWADREFCGWERPEAERYFLAGGGTPSEFERLWAQAAAEASQTARAIRENRYHTAGGGIFYLISCTRQ